MIRFIIRRVISAVVLLLVVAIGSFFMAHLAIPDPSAALIGKNATYQQLTAERHLIGVDRPILTQFWDWATKAITGNLGLSWRTNTPVVADLSLRIPVTLSVVIFGLVLCAIFGMIFGVAAGLRPGSIIDKIVKGASVVFFALPSYWISIVLIIWFALDLRMFPALGYARPSFGLDRWLSSITLPAISLALGGIVMIAEQLRAGIISANASDYVRTLRSRGLRPVRVVMHLVRNAAPAAVTILALMFVSLLGGVVILEAVFNLPGLGTATMQAALVGDIPELLAITITTVIFVVIVNFLLDLALGWINPKVRLR